MLAYYAIAPRDPAHREWRLVCCSVIRVLNDLQEPGSYVMLSVAVKLAERAATDQVLFSSLGVGVGGYHEAHCLVEHVDLVRFQVLNGRRQLSQQFRYEWFCLPNLQRQPQSAIFQIGQNWLMKHNNAMQCAAAP